MVPVYNTEKYLSSCIRSLTEQSYQNIEIIIVDDGSTDKSPALCDSFACADERIHVIHQENRGMSHARNKGIDASKGELITFVDSDDEVFDSLFVTLLSLMDESGAEISSAASQDMGRGGKRVYTSEEAMRHILTENTGLTTSVWGKLYRRELFDRVRFPEDMIFEDYYIMPCLFSAAKKIIHLDEGLYFYRINDESVTHSPFTAKRLDYYIAAGHTRELVKEKFPSLIRHVKNRDTRYSIAFYRQAARLETRDKQSEKTLVKYVRSVIFPYLISSYKMTSKAYGALIAICPPLARKLF